MFTQSPIPCRRLDYRLGTNSSYFLLWLFHTGCAVETPCNAPRVVCPARHARAACCASSAANAARRAPRVARRTPCAVRRTLRRVMRVAYGGRCACTARVPAPCAARRSMRTACGARTTRRALVANSCHGAAGSLERNSQIMPRSRVKPHAKRPTHAMGSREALSELANS